MPAERNASFATEGLPVFLTAALSVADIVFGAGGAGMGGAPAFVKGSFGLFHSCSKMLRNIDAWS